MRTPAHLPATGTFALDPTALALEPSPLDPAQILEGSPEVRNGHLEGHPLSVLLTSFRRRQQGRESA